MSDSFYQNKRARSSQKKECFCALCRSPRTLNYSRHLLARHYVQIFILGLVVTASSFPWLAFKGVISLPVIWALFESIHKSLYRKDLKCPYCGFDPTWYRKDVRLARQKVEEFLKQNPNSPILTRRAGHKENSTYS
jgi:hypothetical protein